MVRLLDNFWLKTIALVMGFLVWFHVATEKTYNYELKLPVMEVALKDSLTLAKPPPDSLLVMVSASGKDLMRKKWRHRGLRVNATQYPAGRYNVNLSPVNTSLIDPSGDISLDEVVLPTQIELSIDPEAVVRVPVTLDIQAIPDEGFAIVMEIVASPAEVELVGPRSALARFTTVFTERKKLASLRNSISLTMPLVIPPGYGFRVRPDSVIVTVEIVPVKTRVYEDLPVVVFNAPPEQTLTTDPPTVRVELTGPPQDIDLLNRNTLTVSVDYKQISKNGSAALKIDCPSGFRVKRSSVDSVMIIAKSHADPGN